MNANRNLGLFAFIRRSKFYFNKFFCPRITRKVHFRVFRVFRGQKAKSVYAELI